MTNLAHTTTCAFNLFGAAPSDKWNVFNWNAFIWGEGTNTMIKKPLHLLAETVFPSAAAMIKASRHNISETVIASANCIGCMSLMDGAGYLYMFPSNQTNAHLQETITFTTVSFTQNSWASTAVTSTTWS